MVIRPKHKQIALKHIALFRKLPLAFVPLLLQQVQAYDWRFPAERRDIDQQLSFLESLTGAQRSQLLSGFERLNLPSRLVTINWVRSPGEFSEQLSAHLWATHQIDAFRAASSNYLKEFSSAKPAEQTSLPRLGIAVIGKDVEHNSYPMFRKLRPHGTYFTRVNPANGLRFCSMALPPGQPPILRLLIIGTSTEASRNLSQALAHPSFLR